MAVDAHLVVAAVAVAADVAGASAAGNNAEKGNSSIPSPDQSQNCPRVVPKGPRGVTQLFLLETCGYSPFPQAFLPVL